MSSQQENQNQDGGDDWINSLQSSQPQQVSDDTHAKRVATLKERLDSYNAQINETLKNAGGPSSPPQREENLQQNQSMVKEPRSTTTTIIPPSLDPKQSTPPKVKFGGEASPQGTGGVKHSSGGGTSASPVSHTLRSPVFVGSTTRKVVDEPPLYPPAFNTPGSGRRGNISGSGGGRSQGTLQGNGDNSDSASPKFSTVNITVGDASVQIVKRPVSNPSSPQQVVEDQVGREDARLDDDEEAVVEAPSNVARSLAAGGAADITPPTAVGNDGGAHQADSASGNIRVVEMSLDEDESVHGQQQQVEGNQKAAEEGEEVSFASQEAPLPPPQYEELSLEQLENARFTIDLLQETLTGIAEKQGEFNRKRGGNTQSFFEPIASASKQVALLMNDYHETVKVWEEHPFMNDVALHAHDQQGREEFAKEVSAFYEEADSVKPHFEPIYEVQRKHQELERKISRKLDDLQHKQRKLQADRRKLAELQEKNHVISKALYHNEEETKRHWATFRSEETTIDKRKAALEKREQRVSQWLRILEDRDEGLGEKEASLRQKLSEANRRESALLAEKENMNNRRNAAASSDSSSFRARAAAAHHEDPQVAGQRPNSKFAWSPEAQRDKATYQQHKQQEHHQQSIIRESSDDEEDDSPRIDLASILQYQYKSSTTGTREPQAGETNHRNFQFSFQGDSTTEDEESYDDEATTTGDDETPIGSDMDEEPLDEEAARRFGNVYTAGSFGGGGGGTTTTLRANNGSSAKQQQQQYQHQPEFEHVTLRSSAPAGLRRPMHVEDIEPDD